MLKICKLCEILKCSFMNSITFTCEVITPMFLGDATGGAELRPPAIKAALRFWWRALHADLDLHKMHEKETLIFGGGGDDARKSSFDVITEFITDFNNIKNFDYTGNNHNPIEGITLDDYSGIRYLLYSFFVLKKKGQYIKPGSIFQIKFIFYNDKWIVDVISAFWLLTHLGNLGSRSRRGAGSFKVNEIISNGIDKIKLELKTDAVTDISRFYKGNIEKIKNALNIGSIRNNTYSHILDATIYIDDTTHNHTDWKCALNEIGEAMMNYRATSNLTYEESAGFGLPVKRGNFIVKPKKFDRRASPIIIKIIKYKNEYLWVVTHLSGKFLPNKKDRLNTDNYVNLTALNNYLRQLKNNNGMNAKKIKINHI